MTTKVDEEQTPLATNRVSKDKMESVANAITKAALMIVRVAAQDQMQCPHRGTLEMIIRDEVVNPILNQHSSASQPESSIRKTIQSLTNEEGGIDSDCVEELIQRLSSVQIDEVLKEQDDAKS